MFDSTEGPFPDRLAAARAAAHAQVDAAFDEAVARAADDADGPRRDLAAAVAGAIAWAVVSQRATAASAVTAVDVQRLGGCDGLLRTPLWDQLATAAAMAGVDARRVQRVAQRLAWCPQLLARLADGRLAWAAAVAITDTAGRLSVAELELLDTAVSNLVDQHDPDPDTLARAVDDAVARIRPDLDDATADRTHDNTWVAFQGSFDGSSRITGELDAETTATVLTALDDAATNETDTALAVGWRGKAHARAAGLAAIARSHLATRTTSRNPTGGHGGNGSGGDGGGAAPVAAVDVTVALERLENPAWGRTRPARDVLDGRVPAQLAGPLTRAARLTDTAARRLACDAIVRPVLVDGHLPVGVGRTTRTVPAWLRALLVARDGGCRWRGCTRPPSACHAHHLVHWANGGPTDPHNLILLCPRHHRAVHEGHWTPALHPDGTVEISRGRQVLHSTPRTTTGVNLDGLPEHRPRRPQRPDFTRPPQPAHHRPDPQSRGRPPDTPPPDTPF